MNLINKFRSYLLEEEFKINILKNKVNIVNYKKIKKISVDEIIISSGDEIIIIKGKNLVLSKLLNYEILITGIVQKLEFLDE